ncbi:MAG: hypothetical protein IJK77_01520 [Lachnospiraceae bacterium]|nr:hypothetical protein [Lachnospiraceae bacterium]
MKNRLWIIAFLALLILPVGAGCLYRAAHPDEDRRRIEEEENRRMAEIEWDGLIDSCQSVDNWYNDRAPLRSLLLNFYQQVNGSAEAFFDDNVIVPLDRLMHAGSTVSDPGQDSGTEAQTPDFDWAAVFNGDNTEEPIEDLTDEIPESEPEPSGAVATENISIDDPEFTDPEFSDPDFTDPEFTDPEFTDPETSADGTTKAGETTKANTTTKAGETTKANGGSSTVTVPTQPVGSDPRLEHNLVKIKTVEPSYSSWGYTDYRCSDCGKGFRLDVKYKLVDSSYMSPRIVGQSVIVGRSGWYFLSAARSVEYYRGQCLPTSSELSSYASVLTQIKSRCDKLGIKLIVLIAPNKEQVYSEYMPTYSIVNSYKREPRIVKHLQGKGITVLYPISELRAGDLYHETYYRNDTHWTPYGAYIANTLIEKKLGMRPADPYSIDLPGITKTISAGDLIQLGNISNRPSIPYFVPQPNKSVSLTSDKSTNNGNVRRTVSTNSNGKSLVLIGDSFRVNMSDTLAKDFHKTLILHRDYLSTSMKNEILRSNVLVLETVERFDTAFFSFLTKVLNIVKQNPDPVTETTAAPTTAAPTTAAPTTEAPTTETPTQPPTTEEPTQPSTTEAPTQPPTEAPTQPPTEAPTTACAHNWNSGEVTTQPTCTKAGVKTFTCTKCGTTRTEEIAALGHSWNSGEVTTQPTCTQPGVKTFTCSRCSATRTEEIPATGHSWDNGTVTTEPTCTKPGVRTFKCSKCDATRTEDIPALGHHYENGACTRCGAADPDYHPPTTEAAASEP